MTQNTKHRLDKWFSENYEMVHNEIYRNITTSPAMKEYTDDLLHMMIESLYKLDEDQIVQMLDNRKVRNWILKGASLQLRSKTSPFYTQFRKHKMYARENYSDKSQTTHNTFMGMGILDKVYDPYVKPDFEICFENEWKNLHPYQRTLLEKKLMEGWSYQQLFEYYNISKRHLIKDINATIEYLRNKCNNC